jgi:pyrroloquinoline quinone biosynthesis protein B
MSGRLLAAAGATAVGVAVVLTAQMRAPSRPAADSWELVVLGIAQDAGIPHLGCQEPLCESVRRGERPRQRVASIGLVNPVLDQAYLFDATPDLPSQVHDLTGGRPPDAVFLTHGHIGHYTGLMYFGRESIDAPAVPIYATDRMAAFLTANGPWSLLAERRNIDLRPLAPGRAVRLEAGVTVTALAVPHRDEFTDTVGFLIEGPNRKALYVPDIDQWSRWDTDIRELAGQVDLLLVDGTFASADEIPGRSIEDIPHPLMDVTRDLLRDVRAGVWFIHLNHTNRQIEAEDVVRDGQRFGM